ncbi:hypothetical protein A2160_01675 [Candidatus Beckwithbacteria bacterium RBG_13_42_9]|uniref:Uncharacterized protein n=1 Tax=Candidatus Beckwithbacteria bacterium RBG_13_42_9 TaxID=1797457 RepID=A0A1F5E948_9BACT|nr:MAG: hypothetical protein A2160_01675 [Candidatus Beckwithbacteria bacterium RBG_13_42_9]
MNKVFRQSDIPGGDVERGVAITSGPFTLNADLFVPLVSESAPSTAEIQAGFNLGEGIRVEVDLGLASQPTAGFTAVKVDAGASFNWGQQTPSEAPVIFSGSAELFAGFKFLNGNANNKLLLGGNQE